VVGWHSAGRTPSGLLLRGRIYHLRCLCSLPNGLLVVMQKDGAVLQRCCHALFCLFSATWWFSVQTTLPLPPLEYLKGRYLPAHHACWVIHRG